jgi:hypothetical protein
MSEMRKQEGKTANLHVHDQDEQEELTHHQLTAS